MSVRGKGAQNALSFFVLWVCELSHDVRVVLVVVGLFLTHFSGKVALSIVTFNLLQKSAYYKRIYYIFLNTFESELLCFTFCTESLNL